MPAAALKPCRFCGSAEFLVVHEAYDNWLAYDGDEIARDRDGSGLEETFDAVECHACCVTAPMQVWQAEQGAAWTSGQLNAYRAYLASGAAYVNHVAPP